MVPAAWHSTKHLACVESCNFAMRDFYEYVHIQCSDSTKYSKPKVCKDSYAASNRYTSVYALLVTQ